MKNLEMQFERLRIDTEQAAFKEPHREGYEFIKYMFESLKESKDGVYNTYMGVVNTIANLEELFAAREISRQDYVEQILAQARFVENFAKDNSNPTIQILFKSAAAYMHYGLANHHSFFNDYDLNQFVQKALKSYYSIHTCINAQENINKGKILNVIVILRYLQLAQKYGYGLIDLKDVTLTYRTTPAISYKDGLVLFEKGITLINNLSDDDFEPLKYDAAGYIKVIYHFDFLAQEWELFKSDIKSKESQKIEKEIKAFRKRYIKPSLLHKFETLLETNRVTDVSFVVRFYSLMVWHNICHPIDALKQIVKYSAYDKIKTSDILYYDLSAYKYFVLDNSKNYSKNEAEKITHYRNYYRNNMILQLFRIYRDESIFAFHKARVHFEKLTQMTFKINHFSDTINNMEILKDKGSKNV
jgi:hypothetical protein